MGGNYYPLTLCLLHTGMRIGEIIALKWDDIDFENRRIEVKKSYRRGRITGTKTGKPRRVDMTPNLAAALKKFKTTQKRHALKGGYPFRKGVFASRKGDMLGYEVSRYALEKCLENAKLRKVRVHDLRHAYTSIRLLRGHNIGDVSYQLGHASFKITYDVYGHWTPGKFKSEIDEIDTPKIENTLQNEGISCV